MPTNRADAIASDVFAAIRAQGFDYETTGGGCDAFIRHTPCGAEWWITETEDTASAPLTLGTPCLVGQYPTGDGYYGDDAAATYTDHVSVTAALDYVAGQMAAPSC